MKRWPTLITWNSIVVNVNKNAANAAPFNANHPPRYIHGKKKFSRDFYLYPETASLRRERERERDER